MGKEKGSGLVFKHYTVKSLTPHTFALLAKMETPLSVIEADYPCESAHHHVKTK